ncbi:unnamed protein product [Microthlaspi erraticum]|uniref:Uncharacterized protein n=1 Tax=Microthlaspi erraticum TaxID=1685480 RepID=A0A6D2IM17_9BRAS|nr:unnamed protein product [Microthlaspi erraticum]
MSTSVEEVAPAVDDNDYVVEDQFEPHPRSTISLEQIDKLQNRYGVVIRNPKKTELVERPVFLLEILSDLGLALPQLTPNLLRTLIALKVLFSDNSLPFGATEFHQLCSPKGNSRQPGSYYVTARTNRKILEEAPGRIRNTPEPKAQTEILLSGCCHWLSFSAQRIQRAYEIQPGQQIVRDAPPPRHVVQALLAPSVVRSQRGNLFRILVAVSFDEVEIRDVSRSDIGS